MNNIVLFRGRASASKFPTPRLLPVSSGQPRPVLIAVWHTNPVSGKLECRWTTQAQVPVEEDGSRAA
ncbi:hypothetical protein LJR251_003843 [Rhizobium rhizogenes]|uniref:hypothetical protein n=1 Tax=Rhizobium rhizogenes TaxID=359 RepID=UPI003ECD0055